MSGYEVLSIVLDVVLLAGLIWMVVAHRREIDRRVKAEKELADLNAFMRDLRRSAREYHSKTFNDISLDIREAVIAWRECQRTEFYDTSVAIALADEFVRRIDAEGE